MQPQAATIAEASSPRSAIAAALTGGAGGIGGSDSIGAAFRMLGPNAGNFTDAFLQADGGVQGDFTRLATSDAGSRSPFMAGRDLSGLGMYQPDNARAMLAEGLRQYIADPQGFQSNYPDAAKFFRGVSGG